MRDGGDQYVGLDRFGRVADQKWVNISGSAVDDTTYTYDRDGNVLTQGNPLDTSLSDTYTYDNLNRLTDDTRGGSDHQSWNLDALGNSNSVTTDGTSHQLGHRCSRTCIRRQCPLPLRDPLD